MKLPPGTQTGSVFRLKGKGVPHSNGRTLERGDQHVTVLVEIPQNLDAQQRRLLENLQQLDQAAHYPQRAAFYRKLAAG